MNRIDEGKSAYLFPMKTDKLDLCCSHINKVGFTDKLDSPGLVIRSNPLQGVS